jgi:8-oxo-dGTP pyrophosphatase MutT (NUDIX family)
LREPEGRGPSAERDLAAWNAYLAEGNAKQARKRVAVNVLLRDAAGRILLVDPKYKPDWDLPGGMAEANEAPPAAGARELAEELGLDIALGPLLCVQWVSPHGPWDDTLVFVFDGGILTPQQIGSLRLADEELAAYQFTGVDEASRLLRSYVWSRARAAQAAVRTGRVQYLEAREQ